MKKAGPVEPLAPGVKKQAFANGVAYQFNAPQPITYARDQVVFEGSRGGDTVDHAAKTVRVVMLDGQRIGYGKLRAEVATGPYESHVPQG